MRRGSVRSDDSATRRARPAARTASKCTPMVSIAATSWRERRARSSAVRSTSRPSIDRSSSAMTWPSPSVPQGRWSSGSSTRRVRRRVEPLDADGDRVGGGVQGCGHAPTVPPRIYESTIFISFSIHATVGNVRAWRPRPRRPGPRGTGPAERLLELAVGRFAADGYRRTSVSDIARDADLTPAAVYAYFANKEALFQAAVDADAERADRGQPPGGGGTPDARGRGAHGVGARRAGHRPSARGARARRARSQR